MKKKRGRKYEINKEERTEKGIKEERKKQDLLVQCPACTPPCPAPLTKRTLPSSPPPQKKSKETIKLIISTKKKRYRASCMVIGLTR